LDPFGFAQDRLLVFGFSINRIWKKKLHKFVWLPVSEILARVRTNAHNIGFLVVDRLAAQFGSTWESLANGRDLSQMRRGDPGKADDLHEP